MGVKQDVGFLPYDHGKRIANWMGTGMKTGGRALWVPSYCLTSREPLRCLKWASSWYKVVVFFFLFGCRLSLCRYTSLDLFEYYTHRVSSSRIFGLTAWVFEPVWSGFPKVLLWETTMVNAQRAHTRLKRGQQLLLHPPSSPRSYETRTMTNLGESL